MFTCSACGAVTAQAIGLGVSMAATPILFPLHKNTSTPSLARHHTQCEPVHGNTFQPELHHKMLSTSPVSNPALGPMDASGSCRGHGDNHHHHKLSCTTCTGGMARCYHGLRAHVSSLPGTRKHALESKTLIRCAARVKHALWVSRSALLMSSPSHNTPHTAPRYCAVKNFGWITQKPHLWP
jgi:hypothetical protein